MRASASRSRRGRTDPQAPHGAGDASPAGDLLGPAAAAPTCARPRGDWRRRGSGAGGRGRRRRSRAGGCCSGSRSLRHDCLSFGAAAPELPGAHPSGRGKGAGRANGVRTPPRPARNVPRPLRCAHWRRGRACTEEQRRLMERHARHAQDGWPRPQWVGRRLPGYAPGNGRGLSCSATSGRRTRGGAAHGTSWSGHRLRCAPIVQ